VSFAKSSVAFYDTKNDTKKKFSGVQNYFIKSSSETLKKVHKKLKNKSSQKTCF